MKLAVEALITELGGSFAFKDLRKPGVSASMK